MVMCVSVSSSKVLFNHQNMRYLAFVDVTPGAAATLPAIKPLKVFISRGFKETP